MTHAFRSPASKNKIQRRAVKLVCHGEMSSFTAQNLRMTEPLSAPDESSKATRPQLLLLAAIFAVAFLLRVGVALRSPSIEWPDEIFNTLEQGHRLAYGYGVVPWEWRYGIRTWIYPAFLAGVMRATAWMGPGSRGYLTGVVVVLSLLSLSCVWFAYAWAKKSRGIAAGLIAAGACATWYQLVYFSPKAFSEVVATDFLLPGLYLGMYGDELPEKKRDILAGVCLGIGVCLRIQFAPAVAFAFLYWCGKRWSTVAPPLLAGLLVPVIVFGVVDAFTWSYPFQSYVRYFQLVMFTGRNSHYGVEPWNVFFIGLWRSMWPMLLLAAAAVRRNSLLVSVAAIIVISHSLIAHKEYRFIYPVLPILVTLAALGLVEIASFLRCRLSVSLSPRMAVAAGLIFCVALSAWFASKMHWDKSSGGLITFDRLSRDPDVCGVGVYKLPWTLTGGYVHLHRDVPFLLVNRGTPLERQMLNFNALVSLGQMNDLPMGFTEEGCWNGVCLYRRPGPCLSSPPVYEVNRMLSVNDQ